MNGIQKIAITELDVLDELEEIPVCVGYEIDGRPLRSMPTDDSALSRSRPRYRTFKGWKSATSHIRRYRYLAARARTYLETVSRLLGVPITMVSVGARRDQTLTVR